MVTLWNRYDYFLEIFFRDGCYDEAKGLADMYEQMEDINDGADPMEFSRHC